MKRYFITGLVILLPLTLTFVVMIFSFNLLTEPFLGGITQLFASFGIDVADSRLARLFAQLLVMFLLIAGITLLGLLTRMFFLNSVLEYGEKVLHRIPLISPVYKTCKDVVHTVFSEESSSFKQVVLVPFPNPATRTIGLVTRDEMGPLAPTTDKPWIAVFVPTTPNPTSGFLVLVPKEDLIYLNISVEDAFTCILSCGVILTPMQRTDSAVTVSGGVDETS